MVKFHQASQAFGPAALTWSPEMADPVGGPIVCHNDVWLENVVFRDGSLPGVDQLSGMRSAKSMLPVKSPPAKPPSVNRVVAVV